MIVLTIYLHILEKGWIDQDPFKFLSNPVFGVSGDRGQERKKNQARCRVLESVVSKGARPSTLKFCLGKRFELCELFALFGYCRSDLL